jgi:hypothetical protein
MRSPALRKIEIVPYGIMKALRMRNELGLCACANVERILRMRVRVITLLHISGGVHARRGSCVRRVMAGNSAVNIIYEGFYSPQKEA